MTDLLDDMNAEVVGDRAVRIERLLPGPMERVWSYLADSEKRRKWLAAGDMEMKPRGKVAHLFRHQELSAEPTPERYRDMQTSPAMHGEVTECDPPRLLAYTWPGDNGSSEVTFELFPQGTDTLLVLTHRRLADTETMVSVSAGWGAHLGILIDVLNGSPPRGFWTAHERLEAHYKARFGGAPGGGVASG